MPLFFRPPASTTTPTSQTQNQASQTQKQTSQTQKQTSQTQPQPQTSPPPGTAKTEESEIEHVPSSLPPSDQPRSLTKTRSWYGSFPRISNISKAAPVTRVTIDPIQGGTLRPEGSVDFSRYDVGRVASDSASMTSQATGAGASTPLEDKRKGRKDLEISEAVNKLATTTDAPPRQGESTGRAAKGETKNNMETVPAAKAREDKGDAKKEAIKPCAMQTNPAQVKDARPVTPGPKAENQDTLGQDGDDAQPTTDEILSPPIPSTPPVGWLGWLGWAAGSPSAAPVPDPATTQNDAATDSTGGSEVEPTKEDLGPNCGPRTVAPPTWPARPQTSGSGWVDYLWPWSFAPASALADVSADAAGATAKNEQQAPEVAVQDTPVMASLTPKQETHTPSAGSTWAFWSRDTGSRAPGGTCTPREPGEIAVIGEGSEMHPEPADRKEIDPSPKVGKKEVKKQDAKREPPRTGDLTKEVREEREEPEDRSKSIEPMRSNAKDKECKNKRSRGETLDSTTLPGSTTAAESPNKSELNKSELLQPSPKQTRPNMLLPDFASTYSLKDNPSISRQIGRLILRSSPVSLPGASSSSSGSTVVSNAQVFRTKKAPKIRRAIAIGVHGLFPATYLRPMIGQPTGTSLRFASLCADGIRRWADAHGSPECEIEKVALEGEGMIGERVDNLWKLLLNWTEHLKQADLVLLACHSQGVPVGIMLLAKLIDLGMISTARIGVCAMAGVSLGPFPYRSASMFTSSAELLEFANPQSEVSLRYEQALREILAYGARITFIGSIDDQLVPLESAVHSPAQHPYIYRAVFIDGRVHAPDFIAHLIGFALKLRNLGISDHGLIRELSCPLAGSLYTGAGHSRLYFESQVYGLAIAHALETTDTASSAEAEFHRPSSGAVGVANANPYHLPWIMRGLLEEGRVKTEFSEETSALLRKFEDWHPVTTKLKDVKYKLEAIRSHL